MQNVACTRLVLGAVLFCSGSQATDEIDRAETRPRHTKVLSRPTSSTSLSLLISTAVDHTQHIFAYLIQKVTRQRV